MDIFKYKKFYVKLCIRLKVWWSIIAPQWNLDRAMVLFAAIDTKVEPKINVYTSAHYSGLHQPQSIYLKVTILFVSGYLLFFILIKVGNFYESFSLYLIHKTGQTILKCTNDLCQS